MIPTKCILLQNTVDENVLTEGARLFTFKQLGAVLLENYESWVKKGMQQIQVLGFSC